MRILNVHFSFRNRRQRYDVSFEYDAKGKPVAIHVTSLGITHSWKNADGNMKPCATHAIDLVRTFQGRQAKSNHGKARTRNLKPNLQIAK